MAAAEPDHGGMNNRAHVRRGGDQLDAVLNIASAIKGMSQMTGTVDIELQRAGAYELSGLATRCPPMGYNLRL